MKRTELKENVTYFYKMRDFDGFTNIEEIKFDKLTKCYGIIKFFSNGEPMKNPIKLKLRYDKNGEVCIRTFCGTHQLLKEKPTLTEYENICNKDYVFEAMIGAGHSIEEVQEYLKNAK